MVKKTHISSNPDTMRMELDERRLGIGGFLGKAVKGAQKGVLPAAEREANLKKMLAPSAEKGRLYHGTKSHDDYADEPAQAFKQFISSKPTWLAKDPYTASGYSAGEGTTYPVYAQVKNPLKLNFDANDDANEALLFASRLGVDANHIKSMSKPEKAWEVINHPSFIDAVEKAGFDSLVINEGGYKTYGVLDPSKIKSATGNRGTYDTTDPDINKAGGGEVRKFDNGGAAFGVFPQMKPRRSGRTDNADEAMFRGLARGFASGAAGAPGDIELLSRILANTPGVRAYGQATAAAMPGQYKEGEVGMKTRLPTSEEVERMLPFRQENPSALERAATGIGQIGGGFYSGPGAPIRAATAIPSAVARAGRDFVMAAGQPAVNVVKPKGGNWLTGSVEKKLGDIKIKYRGATWDEPEKNLAYLIKEHGEEGAKEILKSGMYRYPLIREDIALNQWIDKNLTKYIKNEMGTPTDPVRLAIDKKAGEIEAKFEKDMARSRRTAERAEQETDPRRRGNLERQAQRESVEARQERQLAIDNIYNSPDGSISLASSQRSNAAKFIGPEYGKVMADTPAGQAWEQVSDSMVGTSPAMTRRNFEEQMRSSPWLATIDPNAAVHHFAGGHREFLGFDHVVDILRQDLAAGRIKPEDLNKMTVDQAVLRTGEYDKELARARLEEQVRSTEGFPVHKDYPEQGYKWYELALGDLPPGYTRDASGLYVDPKGQRSIHHPNYGTLEDALKYEGNMLEHCVGGYCDEVVAGNSRIYSLRNQAGEPFATVEVQPWDQMLSGEGLMERFGDKGKKIWESYRGKIAETGQEPGLHAFIRQNYPDVYKELDVPSIVQIKGRKNRAPDPAVRPFIQDFVRSGRWSEVGDIENSGLYWVDPQSDLAKGLAAKNMEIPSYVTDDELTQLLKQVPSDGMKRGGRVHISSNADTMRMELADKKMAGGGIAKALRGAAKASTKKEPSLPLNLPRAAPKTKEEIRPIAQRMAQQMTGEFVRPDPTKSTNPAGKSLKRFQMEKDLEHDIRPTPGRNLSAQEVSNIEKQKGMLKIGVSGDTTISDKTLYRAGPYELDLPSPQHGGPLFALGGEGAWASNNPVAATFQKRVQELSQAHGDAPVLGQFVAMGPSGSNFALHFADANLRAIDLGRMTEAQIEAVNKLIREGSKKSGPRPSFPGIEDKESAYLHLAFDPELRKHFNAMMQKTDYTTKLGLPDGRVILHAITEPELRNTEVLTSGLSQMRLNPAADPKSLALSEHPTYSHVIPKEEGTPVGRTRYLVPAELEFPDVLEFAKKNYRPSDLTRVYQTATPRQLIDQQHIDEMRLYEELMKEYTGKKKGGVVKLAAGGLSKAAVEALTKMRSLSKEFAEKSAEYARYTQETKNVPTKQLPSFEEWKALQMNATPENIEQLRKETGNKRGGSIKKKR
jgi:hypothetical protein